MSEPVDPGYASVRRYLLYTFSLPERTLRSGVGLVGGAIRESSELLVPRAFRNSTTYTVMVRQMLNFLAEDVGGVAKAGPASPEPQIENFVARKVAGNFIDMAGWATFHLSPLTLLAVVSDVAYGSKTYLEELAVELKKQGVIDERSTINHVDDLLAAVAQASNTTANAFNTPPLSVAGLKQTIDDTRKALNKIDPTAVIPQAEIENLWRDMRDIAVKENVGVLEISSVATLRSLERIGYVGKGALSGVKVAGILFDRHVIDHYQEALGEIRNKGLYASLAETSGPYIEAVWRNYASDRSTLTEEILSGRLIVRACQATVGLFRKKPHVTVTTTTPPPAGETVAIVDQTASS